ncbi:MAG: DUF58 domain-containing protein [Bacteroidetes bacterium]|nr:DUF58 domain-containing protein [Bacteroidota bacterium]
MIRLLKKINFTQRFFLLFSGIIFVFALSFLLPLLFPVAQTLLVLAIIAAWIDGVLLFRKSFKLEAKREHANLLSLGDKNNIQLEIHNLSGLNLELKIIDELPEQLQYRDFALFISLKDRETKKIEYEIFPTKRGKYNFGNLNIISRTRLNLVTRLDSIDLQHEVAVYPSIIQMKKYELNAFRSIANTLGLKKIRQIGHSYEFEQIKTYVTGDDNRSVNWKASSRRGELMVNQYEQERLQQVYAIIDKSRSMKMPFNGLSLLDYAINTSLVISNVSLQKHDKMGLLSFSDKIGSVIKADNKRNQLSSILNALYNEKEHVLEANYELLYYAVRNLIKGRSLLFLFTNFDSIYALERVLPILRKINHLHLLVVIFFENTEITAQAEKDCENMMDIYLQTIARKQIAERSLILHELLKHGIQTIVSKPDELSINTINKYLELKARGMI